MCLVFKYVLEFGEQALLVFLGGLEVGRALEFLDGGFFVGREFLGDVYHHIDKLIAYVAAVIFGKTLAAHTQNLAGLGAGGDFQTCASADGGHFDATAEYGCGEVKHQVVNHIIAIAYQFRVFQLLDDYEQVAVDAAVLRGVALAAQCQHHLVGDAGWYGESYLAILALYACAVAVRAFFGDDFTRAVAGRTGGLGLHGSEDGLLYASDDARTVTSLTGGGSCAVFGAGSVAVVAFDVGGYLQGLGDAFGDVFECQLDADTEVRAAIDAAAGACAGIAAEVHTSAENVAELREYIIHRHSAGVVESTTAFAAKSLRTHIVAILVILLTFLGVAEHIVSLGCLLKLLFGFLLLGLWVALVAVGMVLYGECAVCLFDFFRCGSFAHAKYFVVVSFIHC